jgi:ATP-dependent helicase/DNAse subunit B
MQNSKKVSISYIENSSNVPSRFLKELDLSTVSNSDELYSKVLFDNSKDFNHFNEEFEIDFDYRTQLLSATQLKIFLECKYKFYLKYIQKLTVSQDNSLALSLGLEFHNAFKNILDDNIYDIGFLKNSFIDFMKNKTQKRVDKFNFDTFFYKMEPFLNHDIDRYKKGYKIFKKEYRIDFKFEDIAFTTQIDRIDKKDNKLFLIDYKTGKTVSSVPKLANSDDYVDFQLPIYAIGIKDRFDYEFGGAYLYDVANAKLLEDFQISEKIELLREKLKEFKQKKLHILKCENSKPCQYCDYKVICNR